MTPFERTVIARHAGAVPRLDELVATVLAPAGLAVGQSLGAPGPEVEALALEGAHIRADLRHAQSAKRWALLVAPLDPASNSYARSRSWNLSYRGDGFDAADGALLLALGERLDTAADAAGLSGQDLLTRYFSRPNKDDVLEVTAGKKLYVRVTDHCDEKCVFCNATEGNANIVESKRSVEAILRGLPVGALSQVIFSGGEPTLVKSLPKLVGLAYDRGARQIILQTNGVALAAPGALEAYLPWRDRMGIGFSLHATDPALSALLLDHPDQSRHPAKVRAIDRAVELGFGVKITCVVMRPNLAQVPEFARWCWERWGSALHRLQFSYAMPRGNAWLNQHMLVRFAECAEPFAQAFELGRRTGLHVETSQSACIPPCVMPDYIDHYDIYGDYSGKVADNLRVKPPEVCGGCAWDRICGGVWSRYLDVFGSGELRAITDRPLPNVQVDDYLEAEVLELESC